jgi:hypothetical protein
VVYVVSYFNLVITVFVGVVADVLTDVVAMDVGAVSIPFAE